MSVSVDLQRNILNIYGARILWNVHIILKIKATYHI